MKYYYNDAIIPFKGIDSFMFGSKLDDVKMKLKDDKVPYVQSVDANTGCVPEVPWIFLTIDDSITLCFVKGILFEIVLENEFSGKLPNGGYLGMKLNELEKIDSSLEYNDDDEDFTSHEGYWIVDDIETGKVISITIFIPEILREDFFEYDWLDNYL